MPRYLVLVKKNNYSLKNAAQPRDPARYPRTSATCVFISSHMIMCTSVSSDGDDSSSNASVNTIGRPEFEFGMRTMPPPLAVLLDANGCKLFLAALTKAGRLERSTCNSITILAPRDDAFYSGNVPSNREEHEW